MNGKQSFTDYLSILYKWKYLFLSFMFLISIISVTVALLIPNKYKSTTTFMMPSNKDFGLGSLGGLLSGESSALDIGTRLLGVTGTNEDMILGFLMSKTIIDQIADKYDLYEYYEIEDRIYEDMIKAFSEDLIFDVNEYGFIEASVINKDSSKAAKMVMDFVNLADSLNIHFNIMQAKNFREFVENRYEQTLNDLKRAEEAYYEFQKRSSAFDIPEQIKALVEATSELEAQIIKQELILAGIKQKLGVKSPQYKDQELQLVEIKKQLKSLYNGKSKEDFFISIKDIPDLQINYIRSYRELEIQNRTLQFVYPIVEQARIDEKKNLPTILIIDEAYVPTKKYSPKRSFIVLGFVFFGFWIILAVILRGEKVITRSENRNIIENKEQIFFSKLASQFKVS